jgi:hypothetical protein
MQRQQQVGLPDIQSHSLADGNVDEKDREHGPKRGVKEAIFLQGQ